MKLTELNRWFHLYEDFWQEWKNYKFNGLDSQQKIAIDMFRENNFVLDTTRLEIFYEPKKIKERLETPLVKVLEDNYSEYKERIINKFRNQLFQYANTYGFEFFIDSKIEELPLSSDMKSRLNLFNCKTISKIFETYDASEFYMDEKFHSLRDFYFNQNSDEEGWDYFFELPIEALPIEQSLISKLRGMKCETFEDVLNHFDKSRFHEPKIFEIILNCKSNFPPHHKSIDLDKSYLQ